MQQRLNTSWSFERRDNQRYIGVEDGDHGDFDCHAQFLRVTGLVFVMNIAIGNAMIFVIYSGCWPFRCLGTCSYSNACFSRLQECKARNR